MTPLQDREFPKAAVCRSRGKVRFVRVLPVALPTLNVRSALPALHLPRELIDLILREHHDPVSFEQSGNDSVSREIGLCRSATHDRLTRLEREGIIESYAPAMKALVDVGAQALDLNAFDLAVLAVIAWHQPITRDGLKEIFGREISRDLIGRLHAHALYLCDDRAVYRGLRSGEPARP